MRFVRLSDKTLKEVKRPPGLALFTVIRELFNDLPGTLQKVADMGYQVVEYLSLLGHVQNIPNGHIKQILDSTGLRLISVFVGPPIADQLEQQIRYAKELGARYIIATFPKEQLVDDTAIQAAIEQLKEMAKLARINGLQLLYHPHDYEFEQRNGQRIIDRLLKGVGTDLMQLELDLYWAAKAGLDPQKTLLSYSGIVPLVHVKDMDQEGGFTELGRGTLDWPSIFSDFDKAGVKYYFVEQDVSPNPIESVKVSLDYLRSIGVT